MQLDDGRRRGWGFVDVGLYLIGVAGLSASLTILWLGMRAVLDVGGYCAEGGPYVIAQHCPAGTALLIPLSIFGGLGSAALMAWKGAKLGSPWSVLVGLAWPALFISLGWNFLEFAFLPPAGMDGVQLGWLIPGVLFVIMGAVPLVGFLPGGKTWSSGSGGGDVRRCGTARLRRRPTARAACKRPGGICAQGRSATTGRRDRRRRSR